MSTITDPSAAESSLMPSASRQIEPSMEPGDHLTRAEFERRYSARPDIKKAELIEGVVYMPSPARFQKHGRPDHHVHAWLGAYEAATPGVEGAGNCTVRLDLDNEPQPDSFLRIDPTRGGQSSTSADDYIEGAPELIVEISATSATYDLHPKMNAYRRNGVREYVVVLTEEQRILWFVLREGQFISLSPDAVGIFRSEVFFGLWLDGHALLAGNLSRVLSTLQQGLTTAEHDAFVQRLKNASQQI